MRSTGTFRGVSKESSNSTKADDGFQEIQQQSIAWPRGKAEAEFQRFVGFNTWQQAINQAACSGETGKGQGGF